MVLIRLMHDLVLHRLLIPLSVTVLEVNATLIRLNVTDHVDVGPVNVLKRSSVRVDSYAHRAVNTRNFYAVTRPHLINKVLVGTSVDGLRRLTLRDRLWSLLHLYVLFV